MEPLPVETSSNDISTSNNEQKSLSSKEIEGPKTIQLVSIFEDSEYKFQINSEGIKFLQSLEKDKLSILSFTGTSEQKTSLCNSFFGIPINTKETKGILAYDNNIRLSSGSRLLILDCQSLKKFDPNDKEQLGQKLLILCILLSSTVIYNVDGPGVNPSEIEDLLSHTDISKKINVYEEKDSPKNNIENLCEYFPSFVFISNNNENKIEEIPNIFTDINNKQKSEDFKNLFRNRKFFSMPKKDNKEYTESIKELKNIIEKNIKIKTIKSLEADGESLFGLLQNFVESLNDEENPSITHALENVLLSKAENFAEKVFHKFNTEFHKQTDNRIRMSESAVHSLFIELMEKFTEEYCDSVSDLNLTTAQLKEKLKNLHKWMRFEKDSILEANKEYFDGMYKNMYNEMKKSYNLFDKEFVNIEQIRSFFMTRTNLFENYLKEMLKQPISDDANTLVSFIINTFVEFISSGFRRYEEQIRDLVDRGAKENAATNEKLSAQIKTLNEQIEAAQKIAEDKTKEKEELNRNFLELEKKFNELNRDNKINEKEYSNNLNIEIQKSKKLEEYYTKQLQEKEEIRIGLEAKIEKLNQEIQGNNNESTKKANELSRENIKLQLEIERLREQEKKEKNEMLDKQNVDLQNLFKSVQHTFMDFKESMDKIDKKNEAILKEKFLENLTQEIEHKLKTFEDDMRKFCESQVQSMKDYYEKNIKSLEEEIEELKLELNKNKMQYSEANQKIEILNAQNKEANEKNLALNDLTISKNKLIDTLNEAVKMYEDKLNDSKKMKDDLELSLSKYIVNFKMKEDELDTVMLVFEGMLSKKRDKYNHNFEKLTPETQEIISNINKKFKIFK